MSKTYIYIIAPEMMEHPDVGPRLRSWVNSGIVRLAQTLEPREIPKRKEQLARFNGAEYRDEADHARLTKQHIRIRDLMLDGQWRSFDEIAAVTSDPAASISAQLRHLRKERYGGFLVERRARGNRERGLYEYRVRPKNRELP